LRPAGDLTAFKGDNEYFAYSIKYRARHPDIHVDSLCNYVEGNGGKDLG
jgi:hypothetical protein